MIILSILIILGAIIYNFYYIPINMLSQYEHIGPAIYSAITSANEMYQTRENKKPDNLLNLLTFISDYRISNKKIDDYFKIYPINNDILFFRGKDNSCVCIYQIENNTKPYGRCYYSDGKVVKISNGITQLEKN